MKHILLLLFLGICNATYASDAPAYPNSVVFINTIEAGPKNGCTTNLAEKGNLTCGHAPWISEIRWRFVGTSSKGDEYEFTRVYPKGSPDESIDTKTVYFQNQELEIWKDSKQRIVLKNEST